MELKFASIKTIFAELIFRVFNSVHNCLNAKSLKLLKVLFHGPHLLWRVSLPIYDLTSNPKWILWTVWLCWISRELLVCQIGIIFNRADRLYYVDSAGSFTQGKISTPNSSIQGGSQIDTGRPLPLTIVWIKAGLNHITLPQIGISAMIEPQLDGSLSPTEYATKKHKLILAKKDLEEKISAFGRKSNNRFELAIAFLKEANQAEKYAQQENPERIRDFLKKIGSNFRIAERMLSFPLKNAWILAGKYHAEAQRAEATSYDFSESTNWRRREDLNLWYLSVYSLSKRAH